MVGPHYSDSSPIWSGGEYPERVKVKPLLKLDFETAVPVVEIKQDMPMFASLANPAKWSIYFRRSPTEMSTEDAQVVLTALNEALQNPKVRPIQRPSSKWGLRLL